MARYNFCGDQRLCLTPKNNVAALYSLSVVSVDKMNEILNNPIKGRVTESTPIRDYGFMQQRTIEDFDGHTWEVFFMDMSKFPTEQV